MTTIASLGLGTIEFAAKSVKVFVDTATGKAPDFRIDMGESSGPNSESHNQNRRRNSQDYLFSDQYTQLFTKEYK